MEKRKLKRIPAILLTLCFMLSMTACSSGNEDLISENGDDGTGEGQIELVFLRAGTEDYKKEAFTKIIEAFEEEHPNISVEYQEAPWGDDFETKLNTGFASGTSADVIHYSLSSIGSRVPLGQYECLNDYVADWEGMDDLYESVIESGSIGDDLYGIAYTPDARVFAINTELFEEAGLDPDNPPSTWEELLEAHEKLLATDENGTVVQCGLGLPTSGTNIMQWLEIFCVQNGLENLVDEATDEILFNTEEGVEAMEFLSELREIGVIEWDNSQSDMNPFYSGTAAMTIISENEFNNINTGDLEGKIKMVPMFSGETEGTFCGMHFMFMSADSAQKDAAWELIEYMCSAESMEIWMETAGTAPVRGSLEEAYLEINPENGSIVMEAIEIGKGSPKTSYFASTSTYIDNGMEQVYYGESEPQEAMDYAASRLQEEIDNQ